MASWTRNTRIAILPARYILLAIARSFKPTPIPTGGNNDANSLILSRAGAAGHRRLLRGRCAGRGGAGSRGRCHRAGHNRFSRKHERVRRWHALLQQLRRRPDLAREAGEAQASEWIKQGSNGLASALGVLADDKSDTLYVCSDDFSGAGIKIPGGTATSLKLFDLKTGEAKGSIATPGKRPCAMTSWSPATARRMSPTRSPATSFASSRAPRNSRSGPATRDGMSQARRNSTASPFCPTARSSRTFSKATASIEFR